MQAVVNEKIVSSWCDGGECGVWGEECEYCLCCYWYEDCSSDWLVLVPVPVVGLVPVRLPTVASAVLLLLLMLMQAETRPVDVDARVRVV